MHAAALRQLFFVFIFLATSLSSADVFVDATTGDDTFDGTSATVGAFPVGPKKTVGSGISVASAGDTVNIAAGTYIEQVSIAAGIRLLGAGKASTIIQFPAAPVANVPDMSQAGNPLAAIAVVYAGAAGANVTLEALTIQGPAPFNSAALYGIFAGNTTNLIVTDCDVRDIRHNPLDGTQRGNAIQIGRDFTQQFATATLTNVTIIGYQKTGILVDGVGRNATIENCVITGTGPTNQIAQNGIQVSRGATATIRDTAVSGNFYIPTSTVSCNVLGFQSGALAIENSSFTGSNVGVYALQSSGVVSLTGNTIGTTGSGNDYGVILDGATAAATFSGNTLANNTTQQISIQDTSNRSVTFSTSNTITGGTVGLSVSGNPILDLGNTAFSTQSSSVISLAANALIGQELAATGISVDGTAVSAMTRTQLFALEDRIAHGVDTTGKGLARVVAATVFVTPASGSIQQGINVATAGDTVLVAPGTFAENVNINKRVTLEGSGAGGNNTVDTIVSNAGNVITISAGGTDAANRTVVRTLRVTGGSFGIFFDSALSFVTLDGITATKLGQHGVHVSANAILNTLSLLNCNLSENDTALQTEQGGLWIIGAIDGLTVTGGSFNSNTYGMYSTQQSPPSPIRPLTNVTITGTSFNTNFSKGLYLEKLNNALLKDIVVNGSGYSAPVAPPTPISFFAPPAGIDINLKYATYGNIILENATVINCGENEPARAVAVAIKGRNDAPSYNTNPATLDGIEIKGGTFETPPFTDRPAFSFGNNTTNVLYSNAVSVTGTGIGVSSFVDTATTPINLGNTSLANTLTQYLRNTTTGTMTANNVNFNASDNFVIEDKVVHAVDVSTFGAVRWNPGHIYVTVNSFFTALTTTPSLQRSVDAALDNDTVHVQAGSYGSQNVTFPAKSLIFSGPNAGIDPNVGTRVAEAIVSGASMFTVSNGTADTLTIDGFTFDQVTNGTGVIAASGNADGVTVRCNRFVSPGPVAVYAVSTARQNWTVTQNRVTNVQGTTSGAYSPSGPSGMRLYDLSNLTVSYNFISATPYAGILTDAITNSAITGNRVSNVPEQGIQVAGASSGVTVSFNEVNNVNTNQAVDKGGIRLYAQNFTGGVTVNNNIVTGSLNGITIRDGSNDVANGFTTIRNNNVASNTRGVYRATGGTGTLNAEANWWGNPQGPTDASNPFGLGALVSGGIDFTPFLSDGTDNALLNTSSFAALQTSVGFQNNAPLAGAAQRLVFSTQPAGGAAGAALATQPTVQVQDDNGNVATTFNGTVSVFLASNPTGATLTGTTVLTFTAGSATFTNLSLNKAGTGYQLLAMSSTLPWALSQTFDVAAVPNPVPTLTALSPNNTLVNSQPLALTVTGTNFTEDSTVLFGGQARATLFISATQLLAVLPETDLDAVGTFTITVASPAPGGGTTASLTFTVNAQPTPNTPPQMLSQATAFPNPAVPGQVVSFNAAAFDLENQALTYTWNFADSVTAGGPTAQHAFTAPGVYQVNIVVMDSAGALSGSSVTVTVTAAAVAQNEPLAVTGAKFKTFTATPAKDTLQLAGAFTLPTGVTSLTGPATLVINGKSQAFTVNSKGKAKVGKNALTIKAKFKKGLITTPSVTLMLKGVGDFGAVLVTGGRPAGTAGTSTVNAQLTYAGKTYEGNVQVVVKPGTKGSTAK